MLYNIDSLETDLVELISNLSDLRHTLNSKEQHTARNKKTLPVRIPRILLLQNICGYLSDDDICTLSSTCNALRDAVYSPFGWKILSYARGTIKYKYKYDKVPEEYHMHENFNAEAPGTDKDSLHMLQEQMKIVKGTLREEYDSYLQQKEKYTGILDTIKVEKKLQIKYKDKSKILESQLKTLEETNGSYKETLKHLDQEFKAKIGVLEEEQRGVVQERNKLQNQKEAFVTKIREYQLEVQKTKKQSVKSQEMLKKVKTFLDTREM